MRIGIVFGQMLVLLAMMAVGFFCYKKGWMTEESAGHLSRLVVNVFNPVLVVNGVLGQSSADAGNGVTWNIIFIVGYFIFLMLFSYVISVILRPETRLKSIYRLMTIFGNIGFMGIPVIKSIFGYEAMIYVAFYILGYNIMLYTCGVHLSMKAAKENSGKRVSYLEAVAANGTENGILSEKGQTVTGVDLEYQSLTERMMGFFRQFVNPGVVAAIAAVIIFTAGIMVPEPVYTFCDYMGNTTIPLSMLLIGVSMAQANMRDVFTDWRIYIFILIRMVAVPIAMVFALKDFVAAYAVDPIVFGVFIVELGMPVGSIIALMVREKGADSAYCTRGIVLSTLASIVTIPFICMFI